MRKEILNWWEQAKRDFLTAKNSLKSKDHYAAVFFCQQAAEKGLKALYLLKKKSSPGTTHSLVYLANELKIPREFMTFLKNLTPEFITTRYPDVVGEVPHKLYNEQIASNFIKETDDLLKWLEKQISKQ